MHRTIAPMRIYACYFSVIFLALFMSTSILVDFSRLSKVSHMEETTLRVHESIFFHLKRKLFVLRLVCLWTKHKYLCFTLPFKLTQPSIWMLN